MSNTCKHNNDHIIAACSFCNKSICPICVKENGYFCSPNCKKYYQEKNEPSFNKNERIKHKELQQKSFKIAHFIIWIFPIICLLLGFSYFIYHINKPEGKTIWLKDSVHYIRKIYFHNENTYLLYKNKIESIDVITGNIIWQISLDKKFHLKELYFTNSFAVGISNKTILLIDLEIKKITKTIETKSSISDFFFYKNYLIFLERPKSRSTFQNLMTPITNDSEKTYHFSCFGIKEKDFLWQKSVPLTNPSILYYNQGILIKDDLAAKYKTNLCPQHEDKLITNFCNKCFSTISSPAKTKLYFFNMKSDLIWEKLWDNFKSYDSQIFITEKRIFLEFPSEKVYCINSQGNIDWSIEPRNHLYSITDIDPSNVLFHYQEKITSYNTQQGTTNWFLNLRSTEKKTIIKNNKIIINSAKTQKKDTSIFSPLNFSSIDLDSHCEQDQFLPIILAIEASTGKILWETENVTGIPYYNQNKLYFFHNVTSINLDDLNKFYGSSTKIFCLNIVNGKTIWSNKIDGYINAFAFSKRQIICAKHVYYITPSDLKETSSPSSGCQIGAINR